MGSGRTIRYTIRSNGGCPETPKWTNDSGRPEHHVSYLRVESSALFFIPRSNKQYVVVGGEEGWEGQVCTSKNTIVPAKNTHTWHPKHESTIGVRNWSQFVWIRPYPTIHPSI